MTVAVAVGDGVIVDVAVAGGIVGVAVGSGVAVGTSVAVAVGIVGVGVVVGGM